MSTWQILLLGTLLLLATDLLIHLFCGWRAVRLFESCPPFRQDLSGIDLSAAEPVEIASTDQVLLRGGLLFPEREPIGVILFLPEVQGCWQTVGIHAISLVEAGYAILAINFRNQGQSDSLAGYTPTHWASMYELQDAKAALDYIRSDDRLASLPVGVHGVSRGGCVALALAANDQACIAVLAQGPFSKDALSLHFGRELLRSLCGPTAFMVPDWHIRLTLQVTCFLSQRRHNCRYLEISNSLSTLADRHLLMTVGARDQYVPARLVQELASRAGHNPEDVVWVVPMAKHNQERRVQASAFDERICEFFNHSLRSSTALPHEHARGGASGDTD